MVSMNQLRQSVLIETTITGAEEATAKLQAVGKAQDQVSASAEKMGAAQERVGQSFRTTTPDFDKWRSRLDVVHRAEQNYARDERMAQRFVANGRSIEEVNAVLDISRQRVDQARARFGSLGEANDNLTKKIGLQRYEWINLGRQMQDVVTMGAMGMSPMQIATSQGAQFFDIFASAQAGPVAALKAVGPYAAALGGLAATFGVAGKAAWDFASSQRDLERSLMGVGKMSGATVQGINRLADETAEAAKLSVGATREMMATFAASGKIGQESFADLSIATSRYAKAAGMDLPEASARMTQAMRDPVKGAMELNERLGFLNGTTLTTIERQVAFGDRAGATRTLINAMSVTLQEAAGHTNAWSAAIDSAIRKLAYLYELTGRKVMNALGPTDEQQLATALETRKNLSSQLSGNSLWSGYLNFRGAGKELSELEDRITDLQERIRRRGAQAMADARTATANQASLQNKSIIDAMTPNASEMLRLQTWKSSLEEALRLGQGTTQTEATLKRINELLLAGGQAARDMLRDAKTAADQAGMLPVPRARAQAEEARQRAVEAANGDRLLLKNAQDVFDQTMRGIGTQNSFVPQRDFNMRLEEMQRSLETQRQAFGQPTEAAETLQARLDMLNEAARYGQSVTDRYGAGWEALAAQMGRAKAATDELQRSQQNAIAGMDEMRSGSRGLITGMFSDLRQGKDPLANLTAAAGTFTDRLFAPANDGTTADDRVAA
ncbi:phage tail length tape measure family protein [Enterovirga rhinocerotis]|uniref:Phage-related minor tail protein n=1 Tax=Enterovirga rhinocerotis TaxID=1339210 RepID=A0A4R7BVL0_9HYPH|nr:phage tail length tape measure family protein [Enterovirga rhinocerotis]TDR89112.1 phage-related minor tail protein [Enterovirga rhinocerotis]